MSRQQLLFLLLLIAPGAIVIIVALLRGYDVHFSLRRRGRDDD